MRRLDKLRKTLVMFVVVAIMLSAIPVQADAMGQTISTFGEQNQALRSRKTTNAVKKSKKNTYTVLPQGEIPTALKGRKLTDKKIKALDITNPAQLKKQLSTLEDVIAWLEQLDYQWIDGGMWSNSMNSICFYYQTPENMIYSEFNKMYTGSYMHFGTDCLSLIAAWLLEDDFKEVGFIMAEGKNCAGHRLAYFLVDGEYYLFSVASAVKSSNILCLQSSPFDSVKTTNKKYFKEIAKAMAEEGNYSSVVSTENLEEKLVWYNLGDSVQYVKSEGVEILYQKTKEIDVEDYIISNKRSFQISDYNIPSGLGKATLTLESAKELVGKDASIIAKKVKTLPDVLIYFYVAGFGNSIGDLSIGDEDVFWHFNHTAETSLLKNSANCGATANTVRYLLDGDYDEIGYVCHTYEDGNGGGHVYNYIKTNGKYYVIDMTLYTSSNYMSGINAIVEVKNLKAYAQRYMDMYGCYIPLIYAYRSNIEIPLAWGEDCYITWYPKNTSITIIQEDKKNGYSLQYRTLSTEKSKEIEAKRETRDRQTGDLSDFIGIDHYCLPDEFGGTTLTEKEAENLVGQSVTEVAKKVKTVGDVMLYLYAGGFTQGNEDIKIDGSGGQTWHFNQFAEKVNTTRIANCGATANLIRCLLQGDYDEVGYMAHTCMQGEGGGHVYNYIKVDQTYYVLDFTSFTGSNYGYLNWIRVGNDLNDYADLWEQMYQGCHVKVIYSYNLSTELPLSWDVYHDVYVTNLPASEKESVNIIMESPAEGYTVGFYSLSKKLWTYINTLR